MACLKNFTRRATKEKVNNFDPLIADVFNHPRFGKDFNVTIKDNGKLPNTIHVVCVHEDCGKQRCRGVLYSPQAWLKYLSDHTRQEPNKRKADDATRKPVSGARKPTRITLHIAEEPASTLQKDALCVRCKTQPGIHLQLSRLGVNRDARTKSAAEIDQELLRFTLCKHHVKYADGITICIAKKKDWCMICRACASEKLKEVCHNCAELEAEMTRDPANTLLFYNCIHTLKYVNAEVASIDYYPEEDGVELIVMTRSGAKVIFVIRFDCDRAPDEEDDPVIIMDVSLTDGDYTLPQRLDIVRSWINLAVMRNGVLPLANHWTFFSFSTDDAAHTIHINNPPKGDDRDWEYHCDYIGSRVNNLEKHKGENPRFHPFLYLRNNEVDCKTLFGPEWPLVYCKV